MTFIYIYAKDWEAVLYFAVSFGIGFIVGLITKALYDWKQRKTTSSKIT